MDVPLASDRQQRWHQFALLLRQALYPKSSNQSDLSPPDQAALQLRQLAWMVEPLGPEPAPATQPPQLPACAVEHLRVCSRDGMPVVPLLCSCADAIDQGRMPNRIQVSLLQLTAQAAKAA